MVYGCNAVVPAPLFPERRVRILMRHFLNSVPAFRRTAASTALVAVSVFAAGSGTATALNFIQEGGR
jgi:hypothetical protein